MSTQADLSAYVEDLEAAGIHPATAYFEALRRLRAGPFGLDSDGAKRVVDEINTRAVIAYIGRTGETNRATIAKDLGIADSGSRWVLNGLERYLG